MTDDDSPTAADPAREWQHAVAAMAGPRSVFPTREIAERFVRWFELNPSDQKWTFEKERYDLAKLMLGHDLLDMLPDDSGQGASAGCGERIPAVSDRDHENIQRHGECWQCSCARRGTQHTNGPCRCTLEYKASIRSGE